MPLIQSVVRKPPFKVIAHGPGWMVVEKPSGVTIHNDPGRDLCSQLSGYLQTDDMIGLDHRFGLNAVNRLDLETSGLVLLAGRRDVFKFLSEQFDQGVVKKEYLAVVHGFVPITPGEAWGEWRWKLTKNAAGRAHIQGKGKRVACVTRFKTLKQSRHYTFIKCILVTGRKHQIRRHAALAGHPVLGDLRYGSKRACRYLAENHQFIRLALHAKSLSIRTPQAQASEPCRFDSLEFPPEIQRLFDADGCPQSQSEYEAIKRG